MGHHEIRQQFVDGRMALDGQALILGGALFAEMLLDLFAVLDFGQMDRRGLLVAIVTLHLISLFGLTGTMHHL